MDNMMKALVIEGKEKICIKEVPYPDCKSDEVIIRVKAVGWCGTDTHVYKGEYAIAKCPVIPGHEFSGIIETVGSEVTGFTAGQRVSADPNIFCDECYYCTSNRANMCENLRVIGVSRDGAFAEFVAVPSKNVFLIPDSISFEKAALAEPLSCVVHAMQKLKMNFGSTALIIGAGTLGLMLLQALRNGGASFIAVNDIIKSKTETAIEFGANYVSTNLPDMKSVTKRGFDVVIDATGVSSVIEEMFQYAGPKAKILQFGVAPDRDYIKIKPFDLLLNEWEYFGSFALQKTFNEAVAMLANTDICGDLEKMVSYNIPLERAIEVYITEKETAKVLTVF
jgi:2-desacetyl-2-hydroxyethyl bacteriochlorophyllide A dehydrogenase